MMQRIICLGLFAMLLSACNTDKRTYVTIETEYGNMVAELYDSTPKHKENFIKLVNDKFYDGLVFHRVIESFMIQGGDPNSRDADASVRLGGGGPGYRIDAEIGAPHFRGTLAAARTGGASNPEKMSSGSQFYIVQGQPQTAERLQSMAKSKGYQYNEAQIAKYVEIGGRPDLDAEYTVFGELISGHEVIDKIAAVKKDGQRPVDNVVMKIKMGK